MKNNIIPCLWFDNEAEDAAKFYTNLFENSKINGIVRYGDVGFEIHNKPSGSILDVEFELNGQKFLALNGGPSFKFTEAVSFYVYCGNNEVFESLFNRLVEGGSILMEKGKYDWSDKYAWVKDKFGLSWQLDIQEIESAQKIIPSLLFVGEKFSQLKNAFEFYISIFPNSKFISKAPYSGSEKIDDTLLFSQISLNGYLINGMSSNYQHNFDFNESVSLMIMCETQEEIDYYWEKLTQEGEEQACGWLKDKFGVSWQVVPSQLDQLLINAEIETRNQIFSAIFEMKKLDWEKIKRVSKS